MGMLLRRYHKAVEPKNEIEAKLEEVEFFSPPDPEPKEVVVEKPKKKSNKE